VDKESPARKSRRERFVQVAEKRTNAVLKKLQVLANCANRQSYEYTEEDVEKIFRAIEEQVAISRAKFRTKRPPNFTLRDSRR
jgi:CRISPR/Cas system-associated exonuclease Cas4 (RecB family)